MTLNEIVAFIANPNTYYEVVRDSVNLPWDITPSQYLDFAQLDVAGEDARSAINALSNAKRALECQLDSLMIAFGMHEVASSWHVPQKLTFLKEIGVVAPRILTKINRYRNAMEHEYTYHPLETVADFVDVVALFLQATGPHISDRCFEWEFGTEERTSLQVHLDETLIRVYDGNRHRCGAKLYFETKAGSSEYTTLLAAVTRLRAT
jgi:hypothetical protein